MFEYKHPFERKQAELLEQYLATLRHNPSATPPAELDPTIAELARKLKAQRTSRTHHEVRARVWNRALAASRHTARRSIQDMPNDLVQDVVYPTFDKTQTATPARRVVYPVTLVAAAFMVLMFVAAMLAAGKPKTHDEYGGQGTTTESGTAAQATSTPQSSTEVPSENTSETQAFEGMVLNGVRVRIPVFSAMIGETYVGALTDAQPAAIYQYTTDYPSLILASIQSIAFQPTLFYMMHPNSGLNGNFVAPLPDRGQPFEYARPAISMMSERANPIWIPAAAEDMFQVYVTSNTVGGYGDYILNTDVLQPTHLTPGIPQTISFSTSLPISYFVFDSLADQPVNLQFMGEPAAYPQIALFDVNAPMSSITHFPGETLAGAGVSIYRRGSGISGMVLEAPANHQTETLTIRINQP